MKKVFVVEWEEYEKGWGTRPDGYSVHTSPAKRDAYKVKYSAGSGIHTSMPIREFEKNDPKMYATAKSKGGTVYVEKLP